MGALAVLVFGKLFWKNKPVALVVVVAGILVASIAHLGDHGVKMLGEIPQGLHGFGLPAVQISDLNDLLPLAMACFLLGAVETVAIGRMFALKHGYRLDPNREFLALGAANLAAGLGNGFAVSGGMSQSLVNESERRFPASSRQSCFWSLRFSSPGFCAIFHSLCWRQSC
jgi:MFS superfamily sulfate permease-like transporter